MKKLYFIINPQAKNGYSMRIWNLVKDELESSDISFTALFTKHQGHATMLANSISLDCSETGAVIIVIGGDGTLHEVINGIVGLENIHVGFIPAGSGNDFMRGYGVPREPLSAFRFALDRLNEHPTFVDTGEIFDETRKRTFFINNMGAGFDALITKEVNKSRLKGLLNKISLGQLIYAYFVIKKLFSYKPSNVSVTVDGVTHHFENTWFVTVANQPYYGGGMKISPHASAIDGLLNVTILQGLSRLKFLLLFITVFWGGHERFKEVVNLIGKDISIKSQTLFYVHADGEYIGQTPVDIQTKQQILPLLIREIEL